MLFAVFALTAFGLGWTAVALVAGTGGRSAALAAGAAAAVPILLLWRVAERKVREPARRLARGLRAVRESRTADAGLGPVRVPLLGDLPAECDALVTTLRNTRREVRKAAQAETARIDAQKAWLEAILQGLSEGVFVCTLQHRIMLYNRAALDLLELPDRVGLGRSLGDLLALVPLRHSLAGLEQRHAADPDAPPEVSAPFVCTSVGRGRMLHGRMALLTEAGGGVTGYLVSVVDISDELALLAREDGVRRALTRDLRGMVANLRAAAESVADHPAMDPGQRTTFERIVLDESARLTARLDELGRGLGDHLPGRWPMADIHATDLVRSLEAILAASGIRAALVGLPLWLHGDSLSLIQALEFLVRKVHAATGAAAFELEPLLADKRVYLDLVWQGAPVPAGTLEGWLDLPCPEEDGVQRLRDVLERHGSEAWSTATERPGFARLRLPLPAPNRPQFMPPARRLPARPEFYDFGLMRSHQGDASLASRTLRDLDFVVFDCEMTGLRPLQGDEIIQIGAVRVVQGRVLTGEGFERLVNPGRPIPPGSIKFHGLTDADVAGAPAIAAVLPEFRAFVGDAVMVAHNAAFDMKFITLKERAAGVTFDNPVLDTMLLSRLLDDEEEDHSLDGLCERYGVAISGRHTALGDTIGTADLLLKLIDRLEAKGMARFGEVMRASNMAAELRHRESLVAGGAGV
jgi:DNA polymerase-3 subunit epsilon